MKFSTHKQQSRKFWFFYISSYLFVLLIPVIAACIIYLVGVRLVQQETIKANKMVLSQFAQQMDIEWEKLSTLGQSLFSNANFQNILLTEGTLSAQQKYNTSEIAYNYEHLAATNPFVQDSWVFLLSRQETFGSAGIASYKDMNDLQFASSFWYDRAPHDFLTQHHDFHLISAPSIRLGGTPTLVLLHTAKPSFGYDYQALFAVKLKTDYFLSAMQTDAQVPEGLQLFAMVDREQGALLYTSDDTLWEHTWAQLQTREEDAGFVTIEQKNDYYYYCIPSQNSNAVYYGLISASAIASSVHTIKVQGIVCAIAVLCTIIFAFVVIYTRYYNPLASTLAVFSGNSEMYDTNNAFIFLKAMVQDLMTSHAAAQKNVEESKLYLRNYFLTRLLTHKIEEPKKYVDLLNYHQLSFPHETFVVVLFYTTTKVPESTAGKDAYNIVSEPLRNALNVLELDGHQPQICRLYLNGMQAMIINTTNAFWNAGQIQREIQTFEEYFAAQEISVAVSSPKQSVLELNEAYDETVQGLDTLLLYGDSIIFGTERIKTKQAIPHVPQQQFKNNFTQALEVHEFALAETLLDNLLDFIQNEQREDITRARFRLYSVINALLDTAETVLFPEEQALLVEQLTKKQNIDAVRISAHHLLEVLQERTNNPISAEGIAQQVMQYVQENMADQGLSVGSIADYFQLDLPFLSKCFKKETTLNLSNYIHMERIKYAKQLLADSKLTIRTIAVQCGYLNSDVFIRVFRRYEGITPGKYRDSMK